jgi:hypothetical protein
MATRFETAIARLATRLESRDGRAVEYQQGTTIRLSGLIAVPMDEEYLVNDEDGVVTKIQVNDWLFKPSILANVEPRSGDRISLFRDDTEHIYEVQPVGNRPCCEPHDNAGAMVVVHTKKIQ